MQEEKLKIDPNLSAEANVTKKMTPLWDVGIDKQLKQKEEKVKADVDALVNQVFRLNPELEEIAKRNRRPRKNDANLYNFSAIRKCSLTQAYRNRCDFAIGLSAETKKPMVGILLSVTEDGKRVVGPMDHLVHIPDKMKNVAKVFEKFLESSGKEPYNNKTFTGCWYRLVTRISTKGFLLVVVIFSSGSMKDSEVKELKESMKKFFQTGEGASCSINSLFCQTFKGQKTGGKTSTEVLQGSPFLVEDVLGLSLRISPLTYFPMNTSGAEVLYKTIGDVLNLGDQTTVLHIGCKTGALTLSLAGKCLGAIGIVHNQEAYQDCRANAKRNKMRNCYYLLGGVKETLPLALERANGKFTVAVVDIPSSAVRNLGHLLRNIPNLKEVVFLSNNSKSNTGHIKDLCRQQTKPLQGPPFMIVRAVPVDMYPHTLQCEAVILLKRRVPLPLPAGNSAEAMEMMSRKRPLPLMPSEEERIKRIRMEEMAIARMEEMRAIEIEHEREIERKLQLAQETEELINRRLMERRNLQRYEEEIANEYYEHRPLGRIPAEDMRESLRHFDRADRDESLMRSVSLPHYRTDSRPVPAQDALISTLLEKSDVKAQLMSVLRDELKSEVRKEILQTRSQPYQNTPGLLHHSSGNSRPIVHDYAHGSSSSDQARSFVEREQMGAPLSRYSNLPQGQGRAFPGERRDFMSNGRGMNISRGVQGPSPWINKPQNYW